MDAPLRLGRGHALDAVDPALPFHPPEHAVAGDVGDDLLIAPGIAGRSVHDFDLPAHELGIAGVHPEQVAGEQRCLVAAGAGAHFEDDVGLVVDILRQQQQLHLLLQQGQAFAQLFNLHLGEFGHLAVTGGDQRLGLLQALAGRDHGARLLDHRAQLGVFLGKRDDLSRIGGRAHTGFDLLEPVDHLLQAGLGKGGHGPPFNPVSGSLEACRRFRRRCAAPRVPP